MRVLVFGTGAVGSVVGGLLAEIGHEVVMIGRAAHMNAIRESGLRITGIWDEHHVTGLSCFTSLAEMQAAGVAGAFDLVLVTVKSYDTPEAARAVRPLVRQGGVAVSLQNGYGNIETLEEMLGEDKVLGGRVLFGADMTGPGCVKVTVYAQQMVIGSRMRLVPLEKLLEITDALTAAGVPTTPTQNISQHLWGKLLYNAALNPLGTILRCTYGELAENPYTHELMDHIITEVFAVTRASGIEMLWKEPVEFIDHFYEKLVPPTAAHYPSMLRDIEHGKRTEIDALNGAVVRLARKLEIIAPVNLAVANQIKYLEDPSGEHHWTA